MKFPDVLPQPLSLLLGAQLLCSVVCNMAPFLRRAISPSVPTPHVSSGIMLKFPTREADLLRLKPRKKHLKTHKLLRRLSKEFDKRYMSIEMPPGEHESVVYKHDEDLVQKVAQLNVSLTDSSGIPLRLDDTVEQAVQSWLVRQASCPVHFRWEDLGAFFWPRWIKQGYCVDQMACSWPPGMHCIAAGLKRIKILRWHCRLWRNLMGSGRRSSRKGANSEEESNGTEKWNRRQRSRHRKLGKRCKWVKVPYPITNDCYCSC